MQKENKRKKEFNPTQFYHLFFLCQMQKKGLRRRASSVPFILFYHRRFDVSRLFWNTEWGRGTRERHTQLMRSWLCFKLKEFDSDESCRRRISCKSRAVFDSSRGSDAGVRSSRIHMESSHCNHIPQSTCFFFSKETNKTRERKKKLDPSQILDFCVYLWVYWLQPRASTFRDAFANQKGQQISNLSFFFSRCIHRLLRQWR